MDPNPITEFIQSIAVLGIPGLCIALVVVVIAGTAWLFYQAGRFAWRLVT